MRKEPEENKSLGGLFRLRETESVTLTKQKYRIFLAMHTHKCTEYFQQHKEKPKPGKNLRRKKSGLKLPEFRTGMVNGLIELISSEEWGISHGFGWSAIHRYPDYMPATAPDRR